MVNPKAKILIVDDDPQTREATRFLVEEAFDYIACSPASPDELKTVMAFEACESALVDFDLRKWNLEEYKLDEHTVRNGKDIADFYSNLHDVSLVKIYSAKLQKDGIIAIPKTLPPDMNQIKAIFRPFFEETATVQKLNLSLQPEEFGKALILQQLQAYKKTCRLNEKWVRFNFEVVGNYSWTIISDRKIEKDYYGSPLNGNGDNSSQYDIRVREEYPSEQELAEIASRNNATSFVLWNTRDLELLEKQFERAGRHLKDIPEHLQDFFSLAVAGCLAEGYQGHDGRVLQLVKRLTTVGQLETLKQIYTRLEPGPQRKNFIDKCKQFRLPMITEIYKATVDEIDPMTETAWVELIPWSDYMPREGGSFELRRLKEHGVRYEDQEFEYTVYQIYTNDEATNIEFVEVPERNPFNSLVRQEPTKL
jgi:hypothetical protein